MRCARLGARRGRFGDPLYYFHETTSTNDVAAAYAERGAPEGTTVVAAAQTSGRGRLGRSWCSPPGAGLYVSVDHPRRRARAVPDPRRRRRGCRRHPRGHRAAARDQVAERRGHARRRAARRAGASSPAFSRKARRRPTDCSTSSWASASTSARRRIRRSSPIAPRRSRPSWAARSSRGSSWPRCWRRSPPSSTPLARGDASALLARWRRLAPSAIGAAVECDTPAGRASGIAAGIADDGALLVRVGNRVERVIAGEVVWK